MSRLKSTKIEWADASLNPVVGCKSGCPYCYAKKINDRFKFIENWRDPQFFPERLAQLADPTPKVVFMNSMSDIAWWEKSWAIAVGKAIDKYNHHVYVFLTKDPKKARDNFYLMLAQQTKIYVPTNIIFGLTVTKNSLWERKFLDYFSSLQTGTRKALCYEPIHGPLDKKVLSEAKWGIDWVLMGAETGNNKNKIPAQKEWIMDFLETIKATYHDGRLEVDVTPPVYMKDSLIPVIGEENMIRQKLTKH